MSQAGLCIRPRGAKPSQAGINMLRSFILKLKGLLKLGLSQADINIKRANANFKYALRFIKRNENTMRSDSLARKLQDNSPNEFWKEIKRLNNCKTSWPMNIFGVCGSEEITQLWQRHYYELFNSVKSNSIVVDVTVSPQAVNDAVIMLKDTKTCGMNKISAEHLKFASRKLHPLLSICFTGFLVHGILPDSILSIMLVPIIKDKASTINSRDNYRPIALASILSKVWKGLY